MPKILGVDVAKAVNAAMGKLLLPAVLSKKAAGTRTPGKVLSGTNPTYTEVKTTGFKEVAVKKFNKGSTTVLSSHKITLMGEPLVLASVEPVPGDRITIESQQFNVIEVTRDPAAATYTVYVLGT